MTDNPDDYTGDPWTCIGFIRMCEDYRRRTKPDPSRPPKNWMWGTEPQAYRKPIKATLLEKSDVENANSKAG